VRGESPLGDLIRSPSGDRGRQRRQNEHLANITEQSEETAEILGLVLQQGTRNLELAEYNAKMLHAIAEGQI
jgi:hypothetical protein